MFEEFDVSKLNHSPWTIVHARVEHRGSDEKVEGTVREEKEKQELATRLLLDDYSRFA